MRSPLTPEVKKGDRISLRLVESKTPMHERAERWNEVKAGEALSDLEVGKPFFLTYGRDDEYNNSKHGGMHTSNIQKIEYWPDGRVTVHTMNSTYEITREDMHEW
jgi:hypothetical protein